MRVFFVEYFRAADARRRAEIDGCLEFNLNSGAFNRIVVFSDDALPESLRNDSRIERVPLGRRMTYRDFLTRATDPAAVFVLANADIRVLRGAEWFDHMKPRELWAITRWENSSGAVPWARETQDLWAVRGQDFSTDLLTLCDIRLGVPGCENAFAGRMHESGFSVRNYCHDIETLHVHASAERSYTEQDRVPRPYYLPDPEHIPLRLCVARLLRRTVKG